MPSVQVNPLELKYAAMELGHISMSEIIHDTMSKQPKYRPMQNQQSVQNDAKQLTISWPSFQKTCYTLCLKKVPTF